MALTPLHVKDVCNSGQWYGGASSCKYLDGATRGSGSSAKHVYVCTKMNSGAYDALEEKRKGMHAGYKPTGDNCSGFILLYHKDQGYDIP